MIDLLECVEVNPPNPATASVIWLHGLGASGHDFEPIVPMLATPWVRYVFPHAPSNPVTINGGMVMPSWYDIRTLEFDAAEREDPEQVRASASRIEALIQREHRRGVPSEKIVLAGFSQGAALAMHVAVRWPEALAGVMVLSGYLLLPDELARARHPANAGLPLLQCHGRGDDLVPIEAGKASHAAFRATAAESAPLVWHDYPMGHEVCPEEIAHIGSWLRQRIG